jgi:hypothetical protein
MGRCAPASQKCGDDLMPKVMLKVRDLRRVRLFWRNVRVEKQGIGVVFCDLSSYSKGLIDKLLSRSAPPSQRYFTVLGPAPLRR